MGHRSCLLLLYLLCACLSAGCKGAKPPADIRLTKDNAGQVTSIMMVGKLVTDSDLRNASKHPLLTELKLQECSQVTNKGLSELGGAIAKLNVLDVVRVAFDDSSMKDLANASALTDLTLANSSVTGAGLEQLASCPLKRLVIFSRVATVEGMKSLSKLNSIEELEIQCQDLFLKDLTGIGELKKLKKLIAYRTPVGSGGMEAIQGLVELQWLHLNSNDVNDGSLTALNTLTGLERLDLDNARFTDEGIKGLRLPNLKHLSLDGCIGITDAGLANFSGMPAIESLMLGGTGVAGIDLTPLSNLPNLKEVRLLGNQFRGNDDSIRALKAKLPNCEVVIMRG